LRRKWTKAALAISVCLFLVWWALGTGATLAWFTDTSKTVRNEFKIGLLKLDVSYKNDQMEKYEPLENSTEVFNDYALYEPGHTQVVFLEIENMGDVDFQYKLSVTVKGANTVKGVLGNDIYLPNYLRYGAVFAESEAALQEQVKSRLEAWSHADTNMLGTWSEPSPYIFEAGEAPHYAALVIYMPEEVGNAANHLAGESAPMIELGVTVFAQQTGTDME